MDIWGEENILFKKYLIVVVAITIISTASGLPEIFNGFNLKYGTSKTKLDSCEPCHIWKLISWKFKVRKNSGKKNPVEIICQDNRNYY